MKIKKLYGKYKRRVKQYGIRCMVCYSADPVTYAMLEDNGHIKPLCSVCAQKMKEVYNGTV